MASKGSMTTPWNSDTGEGRRFDRIGGDISGICTRVVANPFSMSRVYTNIVLCIACTLVYENESRTIAYGRVIYLVNKSFVERYGGRGKEEEKIDIVA